MSLAVAYPLAALAAFALLAVWLALELPSRLKLRTHRNFTFARKLRLPDRAQMIFMPAICGADGSTDLLDPDALELTEGEKVELKKLGDTTDALRSKLMERLKEKMTSDVNQEDRAEVQRREKELGEQVDKLIGLAEKQESTELRDFKADLDERLARFEAQMKDMGRRPIGAPKAGSPVTVAKEDAYPGDNLFKDIAAAKKGDYEAGKRVAEYAEKFHGPDREKAWAQGELEENDLILPDVQAALPFLRAQARATALFRELRTNAPSVTFPVFATGLKAGVVKAGEKKPESEPTFDLRVAEVFTIAGISDIPNPLLEDFPAARGWISSELGRATGAEVETLLLTGDGKGNPLGLYVNEEIPTRKLDEAKEASSGRNIITSIFRGSQQVRINGFVEPTDVLLNPAVWTDVVVSFETNIGFLYGPPQMEGASTEGPPQNTPPARIFGLPVTWSSYVPMDEGEKEEETSVVVGNFMDGVVLRRAPFRIDVDTSVGFKQNLTSFRGEERMGFIIVRPKSFVRVTGVTPSAIE